MCLGRCANCCEPELLTWSRTSHVGWHSDNELLFGKCGEAKVIVSVKWKGKSCPDRAASSCWLGHGDLLIMDGQCQDEFLHCTEHGQEQERINVTFRLTRQHVATCPLLQSGVMCCWPTFAQGSSALVAEEVEGSAFLDFWFLLGALLVWEVQVFPVSTSSLESKGYAGVPIVGHAHGAKVDVGIIFVSHWVRRGSGGRTGDPRRSAVLPNGGTGGRRFA